MAFLFADPFDTYATADITTMWTQILPVAGFGTPAIGATGRHSSNGVRWTAVSTNAKAIAKFLPAVSGDTAIVGFAFKHGTAGFGTIGNGTDDNPSNNPSPGAPGLLYIRQGGTTQVWFRLNTTGTISVLNNTTVLGTSTDALTQDVYSYLEFKVKIHGSAGTVDVRKDGISIMALTGKNTARTATLTFDEIAIGHCAASPSTITWDYDDFYVLDGSGSTSKDFLGDTRMDVSYPNGAGTHSDWTRSTGADQWATIDETPLNNDTDYNSTATVGNIDTLNFPNAPVAGADIFAVIVNIACRKTDAGSAGIKAVARISGVDQLGAENGIPSNYRYNQQIWDVVPGTSSPWLDTDFNAAEFGYKKTS